MAQLYKGGHVLFWACILFLCGIVSLMAYSVTQSKAVQSERAQTLETLDKNISLLESKIEALNRQYPGPLQDEDEEVK